MERPKSLNIVGALVFGLLGGAAMSTGAGFHSMADAKDKSAATTQMWEVHAEAGNSSTGDLVGRINKLGDQGWELTTVVSTQDGNVVAFLKRAKP